MTVVTGPQGGSSPPYLDAHCTAHGRPLPSCDHCASTQVMARWAGSLSGDELATAIEAIDSRSFWYAGSEKQAVLAEAARRLRSSGRPEPAADPAGAWTIESAIRQVAHGEPGERTEDARLFLHDEIQQDVNDKAVLLAAATAVMLLDAITEIRQERG